MNIEKMREEFEVAAELEFNWSLQDPFRDEGERTLSSWNGARYENRIVQGMWWAWQASRAALVIELPEKDPAGTGGGDCGDGRPSEEQCVAAYCNIVLAQCRAAIEAAGVKWK